METTPARRVLAALWLACSLALGACSAASPSPASVAPAASPNAGAGHPGSAAQPAGDEGTLAPELDGGIAWLNTDRPLRLAELRGHVVVLDFFTYCCVNCLHTLPELRAVERRFADQPVIVIGVHSGKFDAEKDPARIAAALGRHDVAHPVVVDSDFAIWKRYGVEGWPTLVLIDPSGHVVGSASGEPRPGALADSVALMLERAKRDGTLAAARVAIHKPPATDGVLRYPGKVAVARGGRVAIADSGHNRVVFVDAEGARLDVAGSGMEGSADGSFDSAAFLRPQGVAFDAAGTTLYVADTDNHQIRKLDLKARSVATLAGTGARGDSSEGGIGRAVALRSPWDLLVDGDALFIALAGAHQIWRLELASGRIAPYAGNGDEAIADGALAEASFAQPSGLALAGRKLYVADSEVSALRVVDLDAGRVTTLVGTGLFDFGDKDGIGKEARLQHPLGVVAAGDVLYVADTFNNKVKRLALGSSELTSAAGGETGALFEPGGLARLGDGRILVADTNNHRLRTFDPRSGALADFALRGIEPPAAAGFLLEPSAADARAGGTLDPDIEDVRALGKLGRGRGSIVLSLAPPAGGRLTAGAPLIVAGRDGGGLHFPERLRAKLDPAHASVRLPVDVGAAARGPALVELDYFWCRDGAAAACLPVRALLRVALEFDAATEGGEATLNHSPAPKR